MCPLSSSSSTASVVGVGIIDLPAVSRRAPSDGELTRAPALRCEHKLNHMSH